MRDSRTEIRGRKSDNWDEGSYQCDRGRREKKLVMMSGGRGDGGTGGVKYNFSRDFTDVSASV